MPNTTIGPPRPERRGYSIEVFAAKAISIEGRRNDVNQRKRLGSPNSGQRQYERAGMMGRRATRTIIRASGIISSASKGRRHDRSRDVHSTFKATLDHGALSRHDRYLV